MAIQVIAGIMPIDFTAKMRAALYAHRRGDTTYTTEQQIREQYMASWEERWATSEQGSHTKKIWNTVKQRMEDIKFINVDYYLMQAYTGHGRFNSTLKRTGAVAVEVCGMCRQATDTLMHALWDCTVARKHRSMLQGCVDEHNLFTLLRNPNHSGRVQSYLRQVLQDRERSGKYNQGEEIRQLEQEQDTD